MSAGSIALIARSYGGVFHGAGDTFPPMISSLIANVAVKLIAAYYFSRVLILGTNGIWASMLCL